MVKFDKISTIFKVMTPDKKMLRLIDLLIFEKKIKNASEFCRSIEILPQTLTKVKKEFQSFTLGHVQKTCKEYNVNANWIFGIQDEVYNEKNSVKIKDI